MRTSPFRYASLGFFDDDDDVIPSTKELRRLGNVLPYYSILIVM